MEYLPAELSVKEVLTLFCIVNYFIIWVKTSWTDSMNHLYTHVFDLILPYIRLLLQDIIKDIFFILYVQEVSYIISYILLLRYMLHPDIHIQIYSDMCDVWLLLRYMLHLDIQIIHVCMMNHIIYLATSLHALS